jgi:peptidoglycan hydrolase CwlO-like protein
MNPVILAEAVNSTSSIVSLDQALLAAVATLAAVVSFLFKFSLDRIKASETKYDNQLAKGEQALQECHKQHDDTQKSLMSLTKDLAHLQGQHDGIRNLAEQVLSIVSDHSPTKEHGKKSPLKTIT